MKTNVLIIKCDRCHKEKSFNCQTYTGPITYTGSIIAEEWDEYNQWNHSTIQGIDLCPTCHKLIQDIIEHAMQNDFKWDRSKY